MFAMTRGISVIFIILLIYESEACNCQDCKELSDGTWVLNAARNDECPTGCMYQKGGESMCYCDPGNIPYALCDASHSVTTKGPTPKDGEPIEYLQCSCTDSCDSGCFEEDEDSSKRSIGSLIKCVGNKEKKVIIINHKTGERKEIKNNKNAVKKFLGDAIKGLTIEEINLLKIELFEFVGGIIKKLHHAFIVIKTNDPETFISLDKDSDAFYIQIGTKEKVSSVLDKEDRKDPVGEPENHKGNEKTIDDLIDFIFDKDIHGQFVLLMNDCQTTSQKIKDKFTKKK